MILSIVEAQLEKSDSIFLKSKIIVNGLAVTKIIIGRHYRLKHYKDIDDDLILKLVMSLDGRKFLPDSTTKGIRYFAVDIQIMNGEALRYYRLVWLFEGDNLEIIGVINAYRVNRISKKEDVP